MVHFLSIKYAMKGYSKLPQHDCADSKFQKPMPALLRGSSWVSRQVNGSTLRKNGQNVLSFICNLLSGYHCRQVSIHTQLQFCKVWDSAILSLGGSFNEYECKKPMYPRKP